LNIFYCDKTAFSYTNIIATEKKKKGEFSFGKETQIQIQFQKEILT